jgi:opacity protein-like surface antigen
MRAKVLFFGLFLSLMAATGFGQAVDDYHRWEVFGGYSNNQVDTGIADDDDDFEDFFDDRQSFHGFEISGVGNLNRYFGIKGDFSAHFKGIEVDVPRPLEPNVFDRFDVDSSVYNFLGGVQVKDNSTEGGWFRPFGHALVGVAHGRTEFENDFFDSPFCQDPDVDCTAEFSESETGFSAAFGGGIDIRASRRFSIRAIQVDYNPTWLRDTTQHNWRIGVGVVFH